MKFLKPIIIAIVLLTGSSYAHNDIDIETKAGGKFKITGTVIGMDEGVLYFWDWDESVKVKVKNGTFELKGTLDTNVAGRSLTLEDVFEDEDAALTLYLEPKEMQLTVNVNDLKASVLKGSSTHDDAMRLKAQRNALRPKYEENLSALETISEKLTTVDAEGADAKTVAEMEAEQEKLKTVLEPYFKEFEAVSINFIKNNPNSFISLQELLFTGDNATVSEMDAMYSALSDGLKNSEEGKEIAGEIASRKKTAIGMMAPDFSTSDIDGKQLSLANYKGGYVLLDFWGSWCVPCREGNPHLLKVYEKYDSKDFEIIGISDDDDAEDAWREAVKTDKIGVWKHVLRGAGGDPDDSASNTKDIALKYAVGAYPTKILIDPSGKIIWRSVGGGKEEENAMDMQMEKIFQE